MPAQATPASPSADEEQSFSSIILSQPWYIKLFFLFLLGICFRIFHNETAGATDLPHGLLWATTIIFVVWMQIDFPNHIEFYRNKYIPAPPGPLKYLRGFQLFIASLAITLTVLWWESAALNWVSIPSAEERAAFGTKAVVSPLKAVRDFPHNWVVDAYAHGGVTTAFLSLPGFSAEHCLILMLSLIALYVRASREQGLRLFVNQSLVLTIVRGLRTITFLSTRLPTPNANCIEERFSTAPPPEASGFEVFIWSFTKISPGGGCHDLVFSGHTTWYVMTVCMFFFLCHNRKIHLVVGLGTLHTALGTVRHLFHYSVDVVISIYTTAMVQLLTYRTQVPAHIQKQQDDAAINGVPMPAPRKGS